MVACLVGGILSLVRAMQRQSLEWWYLLPATGVFLPAAGWRLPVRILFHILIAILLHLIIT